MRAAVQVLLEGTDRRNPTTQTFGLDRVLDLKTTTVVTSGSAKASLRLAYRPDETWPYALRAMDSLAVKSGIQALPALGGDPGWQFIWSGYLDSVQLMADPQQGGMVLLDGSTVYKVFEVTTVTDASGGGDADAKWLSSMGGLPAWEIVGRACTACGVPPELQVIEKDTPNTPDIKAVPAPLIAFDPTSYPGVNHQYRAWAEVMAGAAQFVGRELFADELGRVRYRVSHYDQAPLGTIPDARLVTPTIALDSDVGIANRVRVRYGPQELEPVSGRADATADYEFAHYRNRMATLVAPWIFRQEDADWYARWALSWLMHNIRPGMLILSYSPEIRVGENYVVNFPQPQVYYVMSVVHHLAPGQPPTTVLGLAYGRDLSTRWFDLTANPAPVDFGGVDFQTGLGAPVPLPSGTLTGAGWHITYYTPADPGQPPLPQFADDPRGPYLRTASGAKLFRDFWTRPGQDQQAVTYNTRPGSIKRFQGPGAQPYQIPELGNASLAYGDQLLLADGTLVEVQDVGGGVVDRQLDVFFWDPPDPAPADPQAVKYLAVAALGQAPPGTGAGYEPVIPVDPGSVNTPPIPDGNGATLAQFALSTAQTLGFAGGDAKVAPAGSALANWIIGPPAEGAGSRFDVECVLFVRFCILHNGYPNPGSWPTGADTGSVLAAAGWASAWGKEPQYGDVLYFSGGTDGSWSAGHVAIIVGVAPPTASGPGTVTVAQANTPFPAMTFPLTAVGTAYYIGDNLDANGKNTFGPFVAGLMRYGS